MLYRLKITSSVFITLAPIKKSNCIVISENIVFLLICSYAATDGLRACSGATFDIEWGGITKGLSALEPSEHLSANEANNW